MNTNLSQQSQKEPMDQDEPQTNQPSQQQQPPPPPTTLNAAPVVKQQSSEEKQQSTTTLEARFLIHMQLQSFLGEISRADEQLQEVEAIHARQQEALLKKFTLESMKLMYQYNVKVQPLQEQLSHVKEPLCDILLNKCVSIPCPDLEAIAKRQNPYGKRWGTTHLTHRYNSSKRERKYELFDIGIPVPKKKSRRKKSKSPNKSTNPFDTDESGDTNMKTTSSKPKNVQQPVPMAANAAPPLPPPPGRPISPNSHSKKSRNKPKISPQSSDKEPSPNEPLFLDVSCISEDQSDIVLKYFSKARSKIREIARAKKIEKERQKLIAKKKLEREAGAANVISIVPWLTTEQAVSLLEMKSDNIEDALNYCMSSDPTSVCLDISNFIAIREEKKREQEAIKQASASPVVNQVSTSTNTRTPNSGPIDMTRDENNDITMKDLNNPYLDMRHFADKRVLTRSQSTGKVKAVILRVTDIDNDGTIALRGVLDRNQIPLDPTYAPVLRVSLAEFMATDMQFVDETVVNMYCQTNEMQIVFQVLRTADPLQSQIMNAASSLGYGDLAANAFESNYIRSQDTVEYVPISIYPRVREMEYKLEFNNRRGMHSPPSGDCLTRVSHHIDGPVLFRGKYDDGSSLGLIASSDQPVELYTEVLDDVTHNIVMILINDLRDDIAIDVCNLTYSQTSIPECVKETKFEKDATGRKLAYRIIVKDSKVVAVVTSVGNEVKELQFVEMNVPPIGSMVQISSDPRTVKYGIVKCIPSGLIVTNDPKMDFVPISQEFARQKSAIARKHVADLHGFIDVEIIKSGDTWILEAPIYEAHNVTEMKICDDTEIAEEYLYVKESLKSEVTNDFVASLERVQAIVQSLRNKTYSSAEEAKKSLSEAQSLLGSIKKTKESLKSKHQATQDEKIAQTLKDSDKQIASFDRELRALRFELMM